MWNAPDTSKLQYEKVVETALMDSITFEKFKTHPHYAEIVGIGSHEDYMCDGFIEFIMKYPHIFSKIETFKKNDEIGGPRLISTSVGNISTTNLRYIQSLCIINERFGALDGKIIGELGIGFGGLCYIIMSFYSHIKQYYLLDLPSVQKLTLKYLKRMKTDTSNISCSIPEELDLFISEYCFSEFDDWDMHIFYEKYISKSKAIYLRMNLHDEHRKQEIIHYLNQEFDLEIFPEYPSSNFPNYIIIGRR